MAFEQLLILFAEEYLNEFQELGHDQALDDLAQFIFWAAPYSPQIKEDLTMDDHKNVVPMVIKVHPEQDDLDEPQKTASPKHVNSRAERFQWNEGDVEEMP